MLCQVILMLGSANSAAHLAHTPCAKTEPVCQDQGRDDEEEKSDSAPEDGCFAR